MECERCDIKSKEEEGEKDENLLNWPFKKEKAKTIYALVRMALALGLVFSASYVPSLKDNELVSLLMSIAAYVIIAYDVVFIALKNLFTGHLFDEKFLMAVGTIGALCIKYYDEAVFVMVFYHIGEILEDYAEEKSRKSIKGLVNDMPLHAHYVTEQGEVVEKTPEELHVGDRIKILPGEKVPVDGVVVEGDSSLDMASLTGESLPKQVGAFESTYIYSGSINLEGVLVLEVKKVFKDSTLAQILHLIDSEEGKKSKSERFIDRFAKIYTPVVVLGALLVFLIGWGVAGWGNNYSKALYNACNMLIISCPCALIISIPLAFFISIGRASKEGILIKGGGALENISKADSFVFDKTGTLTQGKFAVVSYSSEQALILIASLEVNTTHPIGKAFKNRVNSKELKEVSEFENMPGKGIKGKIDGVMYYLGDYGFASSIFKDVKKEDVPYKVLYLVSENKYYGFAVVSDIVKDNAEESLNELRELKSPRLVMLSGDNKEIVNKTAEELGIKEAYGELLPQDKLDKLKKIKEESKKTAYVGDGVNDAPSLLSSDIGISMGSLGADAANESADIVILNDDLSKLGLTKRIAKKTMRIVYENIFIILGIKLAVLILAILSISNMYLAVLADVGTTLIAILNSLRLWGKYKKGK